MQRLSQLAIVVLAFFVLASCSGKSLNRMLTVPSVPDTSYRGYQSNYYGYNDWPYTGVNGYYDPGYRTDPLVRFPADTRIAPREPGDYLSAQLADFSGAFGGDFASLHQQLPFGVSSISPLGYVFVSPGAQVVRMPVAQGALPVYSLALHSARDTVSFVTYGLYSPSSNQRVYGVDVKGAASFGVGGDHGLYVGVKQFGEPRYRWYGPYSANETWHVDALRDSNYEPGSAAYITVAVFNGDEVRIDGLSVDLGG